MGKLKIYSLLLLCLLCTNAFSQKITEFTTDSVKFIKELDDYFQDGSADKSEAEKFIKDFGKFWKNPIFNPVYKKYVYKTCNQMLAKRLKPNPYFRDYLVAVGDFINSKKEFDDFESWQLCINKILNGKSTRAYAEFLEMSLSLFEANIFYRSPSYNWYTTQDNYKFDYDSLPRLIFPEVTLVGSNPRNDSVSIEKTQGIYYPLSAKFYGRSGKVSWKRTGLDDKVYAEVKKYTIDCKTGGYTTDSALFYHPAYFEKPYFGKLIDKVVTEHDVITFPRFETYVKRILVKNVLKDVDYEGGFSMRGPKFIGSGDTKNPARIIFRRNNQPFLLVSAKGFSMSPDKITSDYAGVKFYIDKDSITHPGLSFKYLADQRKVVLIRTDDGLQKTPFYNTYHKLDMYFEELNWKIDSTKIDLGFLAGNFQGQAYFESQDFYTMDKMLQLNGIGSDGSPVLKINQYYESIGKNPSFTAVDLAKYMRWTAVDLRPVLIKIAINGLISFNPETDEVYIKDKLFKYIKASKKLTDYDILTFHSVIPGQPNATINLLNNNFDMRIRGVKQILLSDTQKVFVFPKGQEVIVKKARHFNFSGVVAAGKFEFHGKDFNYNYDDNKIDMKNIDSLRIYVTALEPDINGEYPMKKVQTVIENIVGELKVDHQKNHAGYLKFPQYPVFTSFKESYTFYQKRAIQRGVYNKDKFYFKLDPFEIDSVDNFTNAALRFKGDFVSAGIFPTFREDITLQKDYSLGFIRKAPPEGYPLYGGKANFKNEISLSNKGLKGDGDIAFGPSTTKSNEFIFFPDSMNALAQTFDVKEQGSPDEFPQAHGDNVYIHWMPYNDLMQAFDRETPFTSYNTKVLFRGRYDLSIKELRGRGKADFEKADLLSNLIYFKQNKFLSDTANFHLLAMDEEGFTFSTENVHATIDFEKRTGSFVTNGKGSFVKFDKNQYIAYMERFKWYMDKEEIQLGDEQQKIEGDHENGVDLEGPEFISVHSRQDSLRFFAPAATYNLRKYIIQCLNVPFINVADARIYPDSGRVKIFKHAVIDTIKNSRLVANTVTKYHTITEITANIYGRKSYLAKGNYIYYDEDNKPFQIRFAKIAPDTSGQTVSEGFIPDSSKFSFNPHFSFAGKVKLYASNQFLTFDGGTKIVHSCGKVGKSYLKFDGEINPKEIFIPIAKELEDINNKAVGSGILFSSDSSKVYSAFISPITGRRDKNLITAEGFMFYDKPSGEYRISNKEKLIENSLPGNYMSLNTTTCTIYGEGKLDLGADLGQVKVVSAGSASHFTVNDSVDFDMMMTVDFFFEDKALKKMFNDFETYVNTFDAVDFSRPGYEKGLREIMGKDKADKAISELNLYGKFKRFPDSLEKAMFLNHIKLRYDKVSKSFISEGKIGVGNIYKNEYNRYVPGIVQIKKQKAGDMLTIYFEPDQNTWYYFNYYKGVMSVVSSNQEFNTIIRDVKPKNRKLEGVKGPSYQYTNASPSKKDQFLKKLKQTQGADD